MSADPVIRVTVEDLVDGSTQTVEIRPGDYLILATPPCHVAGVQSYDNGTHVLTVKGRTQP